MKVTEIETKDFRNLKNKIIYPHEGTNIILGENAQGKTNFIEAICMITGGRSFRGSKDSDIISFGNHMSVIEGKIETFNIQNRIKISISDGKRVAEVNGLNEGIATNIIGIFKSVIFSPLHLSIIKEGPDIRRRLIDAAICQIKPGYTKIIARYNQTLRHRNALLKGISFNQNLKDTLDVWDKNLAEYGAIVVEERIKYVNIMRDKLEEIYSQLSGKREKIEFRYQPCGLSQDIFLKEDIYHSLYDKLKKSIDADINSGFTSSGAHRHDIKITLDGKSARIFGSQGQQRSCALAIKLSEAMVIEEMSGERPVIFLDDVMSELDSQRRGYITKSMLGWQIFITCCDLDGKDKIRDGKIFKMQAGELLDI